MANLSKQEHHNGSEGISKQPIFGKQRSLLFELCFNSGLVAKKAFDSVKVFRKCFQYLKTLSRKSINCSFNSRAKRLQIWVKRITKCILFCLVESGIRLALSAHCTHIIGIRDLAIHAIHGIRYCQQRIDFNQFLVLCYMTDNWIQRKL